MMWPILILIPLALLVYILGRLDSLRSLKRYVKIVKEREARERAEFEEQEKIRKEREAEKQEKVKYMRSLGLEEVIGASQEFWIRRKNGKIKELYNLKVNRVPLAVLAMSPGTTTIGIEPDLYYYREKISKREMLEDEEEIRKLNNA